MPIFLFSSAECSIRGIDLAFALDSSGSVGEENFELEKQLVADIAARFAIRPNATQVAVVSYSGLVTIDFNLTQFITGEEVQQAIPDVEYINVGKADRSKHANTSGYLICYKDSNSSTCKFSGI